MKAALFDGSQKLKIIDKEKPAIDKGQVLLKVAACGVCGTDIKILDGQSHSNPPVVLGHEFCGEVVETGAEVADLAKGDFVSVDPNIYCGKCRFCRKGQINLCENLTAIGVDIDGGFAECCAVPTGQCYTLSKKPIINAALMEPLSCAIYGIQKADIEVGDRVVIIGAGMIGIMMIKLSQLAGASQINVLEIDEKRRQYALDNGADRAFDPAAEIHKIQKLKQEDCDAVIECAGNTTTAKLSIDLVRPGGTVVFFGVVPNNEVINLRPYQIYKKDLTLRGSFLNPFTFSTASDLINSGKIDFSSIDIARYSLENIQAAIANHKGKNNLKTMIEFI